jgi:endonuclease/exonuclease/phosphatase family metal-dependent hydrolase
MLFLLLVAASAIAAVMVVNRAAIPKSGPLEVNAVGQSRSADRRLIVFDWNLGYAGLGADAEFAPDGGATYLPGADRNRARRNLDGIKRTISATPADVYTFQEVTRRSGLNANLPMWAEIAALKPAADKVFALDVLTRMVPPPFRLEHGLAVVSGVRIGVAEAVALPLERSYWLGFIRKMHALLVVRLPIHGEWREWVVVNLHLAAYDAKGETRRKQILEALKFANGEFEKGHAVVLAGDWNMLLTPSRWPHTTDTNHLDWAEDFPRELLPDGWQLVFDPDRPTVRQLDKPYRPAENFVAVIDGFVVSPNVQVESVKTLNVGFAYSDHEPVIATFLLR